MAFLSILALAGASALYSLGIALVPSISRIALAEMHVASRPGWTWPILHLRPSMYNFENRCVVGTRVMSERAVDGDIPGWIPTRVNHYPFQIATWWMRDFMGTNDGAYVLCQSSYRRMAVSTLYRFRATEGRIDVELVAP